MNRITAGLLLLIAFPVHAYIGPGAGIPILGSIIGILTTLVIAIGAIFAWPVRRMMRKRKKAAAEKTPGSSESKQA